MASTAQRFHGRAPQPKKQDRLIGLGDLEPWSPEVCGGGASKGSRDEP